MKRVMLSAVVLAVLGVGVWQKQEQITDVTSVLTTSMPEAVIRIAPGTTLSANKSDKPCVIRIAPGATAEFGTGEPTDGFEMSDCRVDSTPSPQEALTHGGVCTPEAVKNHPRDAALSNPKEFKKHGAYLDTVDCLWKVGPRQ